jgi:RHS repeat-associated protein
MRGVFLIDLGLAGDIGTLVAATHHAGSWPNGTFYAHHNHRGDVILTRSSTTTVGSYDYTAFGTLKSQTGLDVSRFKFSSKERDSATAFSYYGYRFYTPAWQRWLNRDPMGDISSAAFTDNLGAPRLWLWLLANGHSYEFLANNPQTNVDDQGAFLSVWHCVPCFLSLHKAHGRAREQCAPLKKAYLDYMIGGGDLGDFDPDVACMLKKAYADCYRGVLKSSVSKHCIKCALWKPTPPRL